MFKLAVAGLFLVLALIASGVEAQELKRITMGYPSLAFTQSHIWVGKEQGLFRKYGVEVDPVFCAVGRWRRKRWRRGSRRWLMSAR